MKSLLTGSLILLAVVALLAAGCDKQARAPKEWNPGGSDPAGYREAVAEVVVTAERPAWVMPEVVVSANLMAEVVACASRTPAPVALSALPLRLSAN
jgi:hypothetical protein